MPELMPNTFPAGSQAEMGFVRPPAVANAALPWQARPARRPELTPGRNEFAPIRRLAFQEYRQSGDWRSQQPLTRLRQRRASPWQARSLANGGLRRGKPGPVGRPLPQGRGEAADRWSGSGWLSVKTVADRWSRLPLTGGQGQGDCRSGAGCAGGRNYCAGKDGIIARPGGVGPRIIARAFRAVSGRL